MCCVRVPSSQLLSVVNFRRSFVWSAGVGVCVCGGGGQGCKMHVCVSVSRVCARVCEPSSLFADELWECILLFKLL